MRPGQNKRMRGRNNNNRKGPNPLTRSYESNGPDVKIRGTAHHIGEKYLQLARDAQSSGDPVMAESYLQHAEHYFRLIAAAQQAQQQAQFGYQRQPGDQQDGDDEDGDEDFASLPDRFASPGERQPQPQNVPQPYLDRQPFSDRQQPYEGRQDGRQGQGRPDHQGRQDHRQDNRPDHRQDNRNGPQPAFDRQDRQGGGDRQSGERQPYESRERQFDNRRGPYQDRDRNNQDHQDRGNPERNTQERNNQERNGQERNVQDRPPRDYDNRGFRNRNREFRDQPREPREARQPELDESANGLPAFITGPSRPQLENEAQPEAPAETTPVEATEDSGQHMRPRRRRRPKAEFEGGEGRENDNRQDAPASDPVGD